MQLYFVTDITPNELVLDSVESHHAINVMRMKKEDVIYITDGHGTLVKGMVQVADARKCYVDVIERQENYGKRNYELHLAVAPTKNIDRFEWFLEKATEIGVDKITPLLTDRSERRHINLERIKKVVTSAAKQSLKTIFPEVMDLIKFKEFLGAQHHEKAKFIAHCQNDNLPSLKGTYKLEPTVLILIGAEGDFTAEEINWAENNGFLAISLGQYRLRTETAALVACHSIAFMNQ